MLRHELQMHLSVWKLRRCGPMLANGRPLQLAAWINHKAIELLEDAADLRVLLVLDWVAVIERISRKSAGFSRHAGSNNR